MRDAPLLFGFPLIAMTLGVMALGLALLGVAPPVWQAVAGCLVLAAGATSWRVMRELVERRAAMSLTPWRAVLLGADGRPVWSAGRAPILPAELPGSGREVRLKRALWGQPRAAREAALNMHLAAMLRADGRAVQEARDVGRTLHQAYHALPGGRAVLLGAEVVEKQDHAGDAPAAGGTMQDFLERAPVGVWHLDDAGRTVFGNERFRRLFDGRPPADLASSGLTAIGLRPGEEGFALAPGQECEALLALPDGRELRVLVAAWPTDEGWPGGGRLLTVFDLTALKAAQARVEHLAEHDPLTGLSNRASFNAALEAMVSSPRGGLLVMVDLDHFKSANERFGHAVGDALLREAATRLRDAVRPSDMVSRLGADEFAILAFDAARDTALTVAGRLRSALREPVRVGSLELSVSASIGIASAPEHGEDQETLLRAADLALREAKAMGRNTVGLFEPALRQRSEERAILRDAFAEALANGELELHLQPQQDVERQAMAGAEALIRWKSSRLGRWVSPAEILPAAREGGLIRDLDSFVLRRAVTLLSEWTDRPDAPGLLGINISIGTLQDPSFAREVKEVLSAMRVAPERLEIEIPEDLAIRDLPGVQRTLQALREVGVPLALDDFGGGHSGLPHVVRLPVQRVKVDRSIVAGLPDDPKAYAVLRATMALARGMGIEVVGEGVETEAQAFALRRAGCRVIQGWLIARPMAADTLVPARKVMPRRATA
jgi:diguanylate cyclase (GGDEF)-like protein